MKTLGQAAHAYAAQAWHIFPLKPHAKEPLTAHGFHDATSEAAEVERWWREWPDANIGLHPAPSGMVVIDVDGAEGRAAAQPLGLFSEPTLAVLTGRPGGVHLYYRHPGFPVSNRPLAPHLDVRADEGYVVLPPSLHPSGARYRWDKAPMLALPPEVLALLQNGGALRVAAPLAPGAAILEGQRGQTLTSLAGTMRRRGMEAPEIAAALLVVNAARCRPPLADEQVHAIAASVSRYPPAEAGRLPLRGETRDNVPPPEQDEAAEPAAGPPPRSRSLAEILTDPDAQKPPPPVVPGLAWAGRLTLVAAREGVGKSTLFAAATAAVTTGGEFLGERCVQGTVLWVLVEEHQSDLVIRALKFQTAPDALYVLERPDEPLVTLRDEVDRLRPTLVLVDTVHRFASSLIRDGSASDQWGPLMTELDAIARRSNAAVLLSAQAIKATGEYRDSSEIGHGVDVVLNLVRPDKASPVRRLEKQKARWPLDDVTCELVGTTYHRGGAVTKRLSKQRQKVLDALEPPMSYTEWYEASGVPERTFTRAVKFLLAHGYVRQTEQETYELATATTAT